MTIESIFSMKYSHGSAGSLRSSNCNIERDIGLLTNIELHDRVSIWGCHLLDTEGTYMYSTIYYLQGVENRLGMNPSFICKIVHWYNLASDPAERKHPCWSDIIPRGGRWGGTSKDLIFTRREAISKWMDSVELGEINPVRASLYLHTLCNEKFR